MSVVVCLTMREYLWRRGMTATGVRKKVDTAHVRAFFIGEKMWRTISGHPRRGATVSKKWIYNQSHVSGVSGVSGVKTLCKQFLLSENVEVVMFLNLTPGTPDTPDTWLLPRHTPPLLPPPHSVVSHTGTPAATGTSAPLLPPTSTPLSLSNAARHALSGAKSAQRGRPATPA